MNLDLHLQHELVHLMRRLVPWDIHRVQLAKQPKANRFGGLGPELTQTHRATVLWLTDERVTFETARLADASASARFPAPVRVGIFIFGIAPETNEAHEQQQEDEQALHQNARDGPITKTEHSADIWFEDLDSSISSAIRSAVARLHLLPATTDASICVCCVSVCCSAVCCGGCVVD